MCRVGLETTLAPKCISFQANVKINCPFNGVHLLSFCGPDRWAEWDGNVTIHLKKKKSDSALCKRILDPDVWPPPSATFPLQPNSMAHMM